jgi:peptide chain release factor 2
VSELREKVAELKGRLSELEEFFDVEALRGRAATLSEEMSRPDFWDDQEEARALSAESARAEGRLRLLDGLRSRVSDAEELLELAEGDEEILREVAEELGSVERTLEEQEVARLFSGPYDEGAAILTINSGAGGVEAERGVHRLVRVSPFDAQGRRHTSFASVAVAPVVSDAVEVELDEKDLKVDTYRASGAGGQHVNKTDSAVRITHLPTGTVVQCQNERSQHQNREVAMRVLRARLFELEREKRERELAALEGDRADIEWGSQIRSYVLHPYKMVKDHRTGEETANVDRVLDGDLDAFIYAYLKSRAAV